MPSELSANMVSRPRKRVIAAARESRHLPGEPGVWVLIFGDMTVFAFMFAVYLYYRGQAPGEFARSQQALSQGLGMTNTLVLLFSSLFVVLAVQSLRTPAIRQAPWLFGGATVFGLAFVGIKAVEWGGKFAAGIFPTTDGFFLYYFILTGLHLLHVVIGLAVLVALTALSRRPRASTRRMSVIEGGACFWHMVDLLWIVLFALIYLVH